MPDATTTAPAPTVYLAQPGYGEVSARAARAFWRATRRPDSEVVFDYREGSLLAANFNALWCGALNLAREGRPPRYFAMIHADVQPEPFWLDAMVDELEANGLDVLGAAVPIKDDHGLTSLALAHPSGDPWRVLCRLTTTDVRRLPPTFTSDDLGHPLLLNTGLWVCRFDEAWARKVRFTINDRIALAPDGRYVVQTEPEDWYFSRLCHELGLRVGATRKIPLTHRGVTEFDGARVWGPAHDRAYLDRSPLPADPPSGRFVLPDVDGWLTYAEGARLAELAKGEHVLEVGSYCGLSTVCLARTADRVVTVDTGDGRGTPAPRGTADALEANLTRFGVRDRVDVASGTLADFAPAWSDLRFGLVFIDGAHDPASVAADVAAALPLLAPGGLVAFHDYAPAFPAVVAAVDAMAGAGGELVSLTDSLAVVRPPSPPPQPQPQPHRRTDP